VYKAILKPVWTYGVQLWGTASNSNLEILERFQSKGLRIITDAPWFVPNAVIKRDLQISTVKQEAKRYSAIYRKRIGAHPNTLTHTLFQEQPKLADYRDCSLQTSVRCLPNTHSATTNPWDSEPMEYFTGSCSYMPSRTPSQQL
jgi:hypothetical protein